MNYLSRRPLSKKARGPRTGALQVLGSGELDSYFLERGRPGSYDKTTYP